MYKLSKLLIDKFFFYSRVWEMNIIILMVEVKTIDNENLRRIADLLDPRLA